MVNHSASLTPERNRNHGLRAFVGLIFLSLLVALCLASVAAAQSANIAVGSASGLPGSTVTIPIVFAPGATAVSTFYLDLGFSPSLAYDSTTLGPASMTASKSIAGNIASAGVLRLVLFGINQNALGSGVLASLQIDIPAGAPVGTFPITITGLVASDGLGNPVSVTGIAGSVEILAPGDTTPPMISSASSSNLSETGATITWTTDEAANSQVEYGTTTGYGSSTALDSSLLTSHAQELTGLSANTLYHYRVKSSDAAGNQATSADYTFTTLENENPPVITRITVSDITSRSATISWLTDKASDSEVEYWESGGTAKRAALSEMVTAHSIMLNQLTMQTQYTFRVRSADAGGRQATGPDLGFTTAKTGGPARVLPRFSSKENVTGPDAVFGAGVANLDPATAALTFTSVEEDGKLTAGPYINNPASRNLHGNEQLSIVDSDLFGSGLSDSNGYIKMESTNEDTGGFFLVFNGDLSFQDGASLSDTKLKDFAFTEVQANGYNTISIINDNSANTAVALDLMGADGTVRDSETRLIAAHGTLTAALFSDLFQGIEPDAADYVRVKSGNGVQSFLAMRAGAGDLAMLPAQDATTGATALYSPFYAYGESYRTTLSLVNLDSVPGVITLRFISEEGIPFGPGRTEVIPAKGKLHVDDASFFAPLDPNVLAEGYAEIESDGVRLAGSTMIGDINQQTFSAALPLISVLQNSVLFSHVASNDVYFTRLSILNPNSVSAQMQIELYEADGTLREKRTESLAPGHSESRLLTEYFSSLQGQDQSSGYVRIVSDTPIAAFAAFGTHDLSVLSAIPPQAVEAPESKNSDRQRTRGRSRTR